MSFTVQFCGAAHTVTGSCFWFKGQGAQFQDVEFIVDCGLYQGSKTLKELNYRSFPFSAEKLSFVLLTHAHIDHSGLLPKLVKEGFNGKIYATQGTVDLCSYMLPDAGHIQEMEVLGYNRRAERKGQPTVLPIYTARDAEAALHHFQAIDYEQWHTVAQGIRIRYWNAGHILGSASIEIEVSGLSDNAPTRILVSGDLGPEAKLLQLPPEAPQGFDYILCESTYGDEDRPYISHENRRGRLAQEIREAQKRSGAMIIPAFAVERTQELLFDILTLMETGEVKGAPVFLDSPLAIKATRIFVDRYQDLDTDVDVRIIERSPYFRTSESVEESKSLERIRGFHIIIAASGMCEAGRVRHHLRHWLWHDKATVLLVGYQAVGTLGRFLQEGARAVTILGDEIRVRAAIRMLEDYSGHADGPELEAWLRARMPISKAVFLVHGEDEAIQGFQDRLGSTVAPQVIAPGLDDVYDLAAPTLSAQKAPEQRIAEPQKAIRLDWHNELTRLLLDMNEKLEQTADEKARKVIIRRLRRALEEE